MIRTLMLSLFIDVHYLVGLIGRPNLMESIMFSSSAQITSGFELFAVFGPFTSKNSAIQLVNKLLKWIKKEENKFFILNSHTF